VPFVWGATAWLHSARDELWTTEDLDDVLEPDAEPSTGPLAPGA